MLTDEILKNSNYKVALISLVLLLSLVALGRAETVDLVSYPEDKTAYLFDKGEGVGIAELINPTTKAGEELYLKNCDIFTCSLYVVFTPVSDMDTTKYGISGDASSGVAKSEGVKVYSTWTETIKQEVYSIRESFYEVGDNKTNSTTKVFYNESYVSGYKDVEAERSGYVPLEGTLKGGKAYLLRFDFSRDSQIPVDLYPTIGDKSLTAWAWWDVSYGYKICLLANITANTTELPFIDLNESKTNGTDIRVVWENGTTSLNFWRGSGFLTNATRNWDYSSANGTIWANTTPIQDADRINAQICVYYNTSTVSDISNGSKTFLFWDDFDNGWVDRTNTTFQQTTPPTCSIQTEAGNKFMYCYGSATQGDGGWYYNNYAFSPINTVSEAEIRSSFTNWAGFGWKNTSSDRYTGKTELIFISDGRLGVAYEGSTGTTDVGSFTANAWYYARLNVSSAGATSTIGSYIRYATFTTVSPANIMIGSHGASTNNQSLNNYLVYDYSATPSTFGTWGTEEAGSTLTNTLVALYPATIYKDTTASCGVIWTHATESTYTAYQGLAINGTIVDAFNQTNNAYANGTIWNYTSYSLTSYTHGDKVSCWTRANISSETSAINYTANITLSNHVPTISGLTITSPIITDIDTVGSATLSDAEGDTINCLFMWYRNGTNIYNSTQSPCTNTSTLTKGNYSAGDIISFGINATDSYGGATAQSNSSSVTVMTTFTNNLISLYPATAYKNTTLSCGVNWISSVIAPYFTVYQGLAINGTIVDAFNQSSVAYVNGTLWNYTSYSVSAYTHGDKVSCWSYATNTTYTSAKVYTSNLTLSNYVPTISGITLTNPLINGQNATGTATLSDYEGDTLGCTFVWYRNESSIKLDVQNVCTNTSTLTSGNYSLTDIIYFSIVANDSYGGTSATYWSENVTVTPPFMINNYTYTGTQYETVAYSRSINITVPSGEVLNSAVVEINSVNFTATCTNASTTYYCDLNNTPAPPVSNNATVKTNTWYLNYTSGATTILTTQTYNTTILYGVWPTGITSSEEVAMESNAQVNLTYGNASGFLALTATLTSSAEIGGNSGSLTCSGGLCTGNVATPTVTKNMIYRVGANYTITSPFWGTSVTRNVSIESNAGSETSTLQTYTGTCTSPSNYNDSSWTTYATAGTSCVIYENYTLTKMANTTAWRTKDTAGTRDITIPEDCWSKTLQFKVLRNSTLAQYYCWNYTTDSFVMLNSYTFSVNYYLYEENLTTANWYNNSYTRVVPYGLSTSCATGDVLFTYTCKDEDSKATISCDYEQLFVLTLDTGGESDYSFSGTDTTWDICITPSTLNGTVDSVEQYSGTGYESRDYFLFDVQTSGMPYNETIYLGSDNDTQLTYIYVKRAGVKVSGAYVYVQKYYIGNDTFENVAMGKTDSSDGKANTYLVPNTAWYRFIVEEDGEVVYTSDTQHIACSPSASYCTVTLNIESSAIEFWDYQNGITSACTFANSTKIIACTFTVNSGASEQFEFYVYNFTKGMELLYNNNLTTSSGTLYYDLGDENSTGRYSYYLRVDGTILNSGTVNLATVSDWGEDSPILALMLILTLAFCFSLAGPSMMVIGAYLGVVISWLFEFINLGSADLYVIGGLGIVTAVLVYAFKR